MRKGRYNGKHAKVNLYKNRYNCNLGNWKVGKISRITDGRRIKYRFRL